MDFTVLPHGKNPPDYARSQAFLVTDNWDDWFQFSTLYILIYFDDNAEKHRIGEIKIGQFGMGDAQRSPNIPNHFEQLGQEFFSLGQDELYYEELNKLNPELRDYILISLNDCAKDLNLFEQALKEEVTGVSLLRTVTKSTVMGQFHRLTMGGVRLSDYEFTYVGPQQVERGLDPIKIDFSVRAESEPPTNIHVLIGRNGVGKTHLLHAMTCALVQTSVEKYETGCFHNENQLNDTDIFANIVSVSFSAFDSFEPLPEPRNKSEGIRYSYVGLKKKKNNNSEQPDAPKSPSALGAEFAQSMKICRKGARAYRWRKALEALEADPIFKAATVSELANENDDEELKINASKTFSKLSSGHKIVLLTITRLVEVVEERTLVLLDEPEAHLHPPLLSAFVRALSDLLIDRNGVAIIATHSPVVLQEVPKNCVWKASRSGKYMKIERPENETFGENVGVLTREIFGLEVTHSGFHKLILERVAEYDTYEEVIRHFDGQLGEEAKAIIQAHITSKGLQEIE